MAGEADASSAPTVLASLYVGDLAMDVTDDVLYEAFSEFKSLASVRVCQDSSTGRSLGYGYVNFVSPDDATRAIEEKNHSKLNDRLIRVMWSHRDPDARNSGIGNVFVKNLDESIDSAKLQDMFQKFGKILSCKVVSSDNGKSKGYGFIQFESEASAEAAIEKLNGLMVGGKQMYVGKFLKKSDRAVPGREEKYTNLYVKNLETSFSEEGLREKFSQYGTIVSLAISKDEKGASRGFGFVNFENPEDAKRAVEALHGSQWGSKILYVTRAQKKSEREEVLRRQFEEKRKEQILKYQASNVYVKNIDDDITDEELRELFSRCGTITSAKLMRDDRGISKGFGFVCFSTPEEANQAVYTFHGFILHRKPLYVAIAQRKEERQVKLQAMYAQRMAGLAGPSAIIPGGYSPFYYPSPPVVSQLPAQPGLMYQPPGIRPGWRPNGIVTPARPPVQPLHVPMTANNNRPNRQTRGRMNGNVLPQGPGLAYAAPHSQRMAHPVASSKDFSNHNQQQRVGHLQEGNNGLASRAQPNFIGAEGQEMLSSLLAAALPEQQKQILGEHLYPLVAHHQPDLASKITGMILEMDNSEILVLLDSRESLAAKVEEAVQVLRLSKSKASQESGSSSSSSSSLHSNYRSSEVTVN
ncbi:polyadenylate-binding protein 7 [Andrographis paniculata]|uniref:polyadenylate-binding protein 7 n=1 Tax=Andrographis paniculata TaxID=175694 RepID=UPI0021E88379|nr:polyadenylate-binding protein 7 [Andrographis paniculata]